MGNSQSSGGGGSGGQQNNHNKVVRDKPTGTGTLTLGIFKGSIENTHYTTFSDPNSFNTGNKSSLSGLGNSNTNSGYSGGGLLSTQDQHIQNVKEALGNTGLMGGFNDKGKKKTCLEMVSIIRSKV